MVKCGLYEIDKTTSGANATSGPSPVQKMFRDLTKVMLDWRGPGTGPGPVLTLSLIYWYSVAPHLSVLSSAQVCSYILRGTVRKRVTIH